MYLMYSICHMTSQDHPIVGLCGFMGGRSLQCCHHGKFGDHTPCGSGEIMFLVVKKEEVKILKY